MHGLALQAQVLVFQLFGGHFGHVAGAHLGHKATHDQFPVLVAVLLDELEEEFGLQGVELSVAVLVLGLGDGFPFRLAGIAVEAKGCCNVAPGLSLRDQVVEKRQTFFGPLGVVQARVERGRVAAVAGARGDGEDGPD